MTPSIIIIGGGAAGLMAGIAAARQGHPVTILEKKDRVGRKLAITGKGRCNVCNTAPMKEAIDHFFPSGKFLYQCFSRFYTPDLIALLEENQVRLKTERGGRMFPQSDKAADIIAALARSFTRLGGVIRTSVPVKALLIEDSFCRGVITQSGQEIRAAATILTTGGASYPATGSTGDGYRLAAMAGHTIVPIRPALVPVVTAGDLAKRLQGLALKNVQVTVWMDGKKTDSLFGEMLFTHFGVSGPIILSLSHAMVQGLGAGKDVQLTIDLKPALDHKQLDARLLRDMDTFGKKKTRTLLKGLLPASLIPVCLDELGFDPDVPAHQITSGMRKKLRNWLKEFRLDVTGHRPLREAIVTAGGIATKEIDPKTMRSKICSGLLCAGEVLDIQADTGGFNLMAAFSTGWMAGASAVNG
ncbi:NAD(P)/FAD-dependent oxidoreductase [Desulfoplanes formicivorans]|uniref:FAD-dependent oxidoreductase n=1 Tax=Desulfoplanes formicivorans TaxID=1592317 RepID=A0A194AKW5_9BACT|nr:NAD(P)/FAD-dependent oxidoreductase [Desulfoplanes formicivorans]GAU09958.1 FAD-dependent oxidoreductase [Desulfoplanes formicivorans]